MENRCYFIELLAYWEGKVTTRHLREQFGISRQQASKDLKHYNQQILTPLIYHSSLKGFIPPCDYSPQFISKEAEQYLTWLASGSLDSGQVNTANLTFQLCSKQRYISPEVMRGLVAAMRQQNRLEVDYVSLSQPDREGRIIVPHTFVDTGTRWHLRAWCEKHNDYRDFVLSRFRGTPELLGASEHNLANDLAWNTQVELIFEPDIRLSAAQQAVIAEDYQMR
ncbi:WYL domain-containing protein, partial [Agarivorans sp.]|uniref:WYL domain-containing protein n=1 Tax=Agarivorans sp. TaxID=1872412 RepID=UPI003D002E73